MSDPTRISIHREGVTISSTETPVSPALLALERAGISIQSGWTFRTENFASPLSKDSTSRVVPEYQKIGAAVREHVDPTRAQEPVAYFGAGIDGALPWLVSPAAKMCLTVGNHQLGSLITEEGGGLLSAKGQNNCATGGYVNGAWVMDLTGDNLCASLLEIPGLRIRSVTTAQPQEKRMTGKYLGADDGIAGALIVTFDMGPRTRPQTHLHVTAFVHPLNTELNRLVEEIRPVGLVTKGGEHIESDMPFEQYITEGGFYLADDWGSKGPFSNERWTSTREPLGIDFGYYRAVLYHSVMSAQPASTSLMSDDGFTEGQV